jgi:dihydroxyacetone synthase
MFLYALYHLVGFDAWTMDELKGYGSAKLNDFTTLCHAHPEIEVPGVEVTTGPLGQGIANAVGLAIASKNLGARFNKPGYDVVQSRIYCISGDGCLMEGVALESIALAGHLQLDNLVLIYDNNQVTCDGPLSWINTEDINAKMRACGWAVMEVEDGSNDVHAIVTALQAAQTVQGRPAFINIHTVIGAGTGVAGTFKAHHGVFDADSVIKSKNAAGIDPSQTHQVPDRALKYFRERKKYGQKLNQDWNTLVKLYGLEYPRLRADFVDRLSGEMDQSVFEALDAIDTTSMSKLATRESNGLIMEKMWPLCKALCGGGADLVNSNKVYYSETDVFLPDHFEGRYIRYGIREHAMASISNGIAAYGKGTFIPITATFLMFYLYVRVPSS